MNYSVGDIVSLLDVSHSSVRRWSATFARHLSPEANPGRGRAREFTDDDLRVFAYIKSRTDRRIPIEEVEKEVATAQLPELAEILGAGRAMVADDTLLAGLTQLMATSQGTQQQIADSLDKLGDTMALAADLAALRQEVALLRQQVEALQSLQKQSHKHSPGFPWRPTYDTPDTP